MKPKNDKLLYTESDIFMAMEYGIGIICGLHNLEVSKKFRKDNFLNLLQYLSNPNIWRPKPIPPIFWKPITELPKVPRKSAGIWIVYLFPKISEGNHPSRLSHYFWQQGTEHPDWSSGCQWATIQELVQQAGFYD